MGLKNSGDIFCRAITGILQKVKNKKNFKSFVDDLIIHSENFKVYLDTLKNIFDIFRNHNIRLNGSKCEFLFKKAKFLGRIIDNEGYKADPDNVSAVKALEPPKSQKQVSQAIGRFNWLRDFISSNIGEEVAKFCFSELISELNKLNKKNSKFNWTERAQECFENTKNRLSSDKCISFANFNEPFTLVTDASGIAVAGILLQIENGKQK